MNAMHGAEKNPLHPHVGEGQFPPPSPGDHKIGSGDRKIGSASGLPQGKNFHSCYHVGKFSARVEQGTRV